MTKHFYLFYLIVVVILCDHTRTLSQNNRNISLNIHYGFIISHHPYMEHLTKSHIPSIELNLFKATYGEKQWEQLYHYPETGISFYSSYLENPSQLGYLYGIYPYINFKLNRASKQKIYLRAGMGISYVTQKFDRITNYKNIAIGSHYNGMMALRMNHKIIISKIFQIETGLGLTHFSNGSMVTPNLGINMITANIGFTYSAGKEHSIIRDSIPAAIKKWNYTIIAGGGATEIDPPGGKPYGAYTISANIEKTCNHQLRFVTGIDWFYNNANLEKLKRKNVVISGESENMQIGTKIGCALTIARLILPFEMGVYVYTKPNSSGYIYHRVGIRYQITNHFIANITLKTHFVKADYVEWGLGYQF